MDLNFSEQDRAFQQEVRDFIPDGLPADIQEKMKKGLKMRREDFVRWMRILAGKGWLVPEWPEEYGGSPLTPVQRYILTEELTRAYAPLLINQGVRMVGPVLYSFGTDEQKEKYLPRIINSDDIWCQGYSEPGSGSDLASLQTRAVRDGDHYIVNGTKTWTSHAHFADRMFCLCRTDPDVKFQEGISFLLIDMDQPGVEVKPIIMMEGTHHVNTVYLTDVKVPVEDLVGEENKGWTYAKFLLSHERIGIAKIGYSKAQLGKLKEIAALQPSGGARLIDDMDFASKIAQLEIDLDSLQHTELRAVMATARGDAPGPEASVLKIKGTEVAQSISNLLMQTVDYYSAPFIPEAMEAGWNETPVGPDYAATLGANYFSTRKASIVGGTNEIQRNIIAKGVLGM